MLTDQESRTLSEMLDDLFAEYEQQLKITVSIPGIDSDSVLQSDYGGQSQG